MGNVSLRTPPVPEYCPIRRLQDFDADHNQGAKAASKRDRKDKDTKVAKSQLKVNEQAKDILTGPFAFSVTKYIHAVDIKEKSVELTLCDTPGFEDN